MKKRYALGLLAMLLATVGLLALADRSARDFSRQIENVTFSVYQFGPSTPMGLTLWSDDLTTDDQAAIRKILQVHEVTVQQLQQELFGDAAMTMEELVYASDLRSANYAELRADDSLQLGIYYTMKNGDTPYFRALFPYTDELAGQEGTPAHAVKTLFDDPDVLLRLRLPQADRLLTDSFRLYFYGDDLEQASGTAPALSGVKPEHIPLIRDALEEDIRAGRAGEWRPPWERTEKRFHIDLMGWIRDDVPLEALEGIPRPAEPQKKITCSLVIYEDQTDTATEQLLIQLGYYHKKAE